MIGRNDPCICGSGKKYKKCCASKEMPTVTEVQTEELERVLQTFYETHPEKADVQNYLDLLKTWRQALDPYLIEEMVEAIVMDEFFFHHRPEIWENYLEKQQKRAIRPSVVEVLKTWQLPRIFVGKVVDVDADYMTVTHVLQDETIQVRRESERPVPVGVHIYCFILPDGSLKENHYLAVSTLIFFPADHDGVFVALQERFSSRQDQSVSGFMQENGLAFWELLCEDGYRGDEFTNFESNVLQKAVQFLEGRERDIERFIEVIEDYLVELQPNARKDVAIAAGAIRFGQENELFEPLGMTVKEIAETFGVSTSTLNKYYNDMNVYYKRVEA